MDGPIRSLSWVSARTGQQSVPEVVDSDLPKLSQKPPTALALPYSLSYNPSPPILTLGLSEVDPALVELNKELYDFLALALRAFVQTWWGQITPRDRDFMPQITRVITHVIQDIEQRASRVDLSHLVLRHVPALVNLHLNDYRVAAMRMGTAFTHTLPSPTVPGLFHVLQPHVAIQTNQEPSAPIISQIYLRQLVENILRLSLPSEDWESETERAIVREIVACVVLGNMFKKLAQPWFLHQIILGLLKPSLSTQSESKESFSRFRIPSVQVLVIFVLSAMQTISSLALSIISTFQHLVALTHAANRACERRKSPQRRNTSDSITSLSSSIEGNTDTTVEVISEPEANEDILAPSLKLVGNLIQAENRLPVTASLLLVRLSSQLFQPWLERLIPFMLSRAISPTSLTNAIQAGKKALFPNDGWPGPAPVEPTIEEQLLLREQLEGRLSELCHPWLASVILGSSRKTQALTIKQALDPFSESAEINSHLLVMLLDLVVSELWPELSKSP